MAYAIRVKMSDREYAVALVGDMNCQDIDCAVLEGEILTILHVFDVIQFNLNSAKIIRTVPLDSMFPNFSIYRVGGGYLIHGEVEIIMLNEDLEKVWTFGGRDIFVSVTGKEAFRIGEDRICLYDFEDNYYEIDFQGRLLKDVCHRPK